MILGLSAVTGFVPILAAAQVDVLVFLACAVIVLTGAIGVVINRNPVHAALMLVLTLFGVAVLFIEQDAQFLAAVQVIVYAGAIVVLFLFVIMLLGVDKEDRIEVEPLRAQRPIAAVLVVLGFAELLLLSRVTNWTTGAQSGSGAGAASVPGASNVELLGRAVFSIYLLPFELTSALLVIAVVGAVVLARRPKPRPGGEEPDELEEVDEPAPTAEPAATTEPVVAEPAATERVSS